MEYLEFKVLLGGQISTLFLFHTIRTERDSLHFQKGDEKKVNGSPRTYLPLPDVRSLGCPRSSRLVGRKGTTSAEEMGSGCLSLGVSGN